MGASKVGELAAALSDSVQTVSGSTSVELRRKVFERAAASVKQRRGPDLGDLDGFVDSIAEEPTRADVESLLAKGMSEDAIYEVVVTASVGAGYARVEKALMALKAVKT
jgi:alkylhydroperoxidase/carboxymuconolactone decarboxylase family protein YurZ